VKAEYRAGGRWQFGSAGAERVGSRGRPANLHVKPDKLLSRGALRPAAIALSDGAKVHVALR